MVPNPPPLPVFVAVEEEAPSALRYLSPLVANGWSLLTAYVVITLEFVYTLWGHQYPGSPVANALVCGMLWCSLPQATAAAFALLLARHRRRRSSRDLGFVAIVAATVNHCMYAGFIFVGVESVTRTEKVVNSVFGFVTVFLLVAGDVMGFLSHLFGEDDD